MPELTVRLLFTGVFTLTVSVLPPVLLTRNVLNVGDPGPLMLCAPDPLKLKVPVPELNRGPDVVETVRFPVMFVVLAGAALVTALLVRDDGRVIGHGYREFTQHFPEPGRVEHDATEIWATQSGVMHDIPDGEKWFGYPAQPDRQMKRQILAVQQLPELLRRVAQLEKALEAKSGGGEKK